MFAILMTTSSVVLIISNLAAGKIWSLFGIPVDGGIIIFPLSYIIGDLIVGLYGERRANKVVFVSMLMMALTIGTTWVVANWLPPFEGWDGQEAFASVFGTAGRITIASLISYLLSNLVNNRTFVGIRRGFIGKALGSSAVARLIDSLTFETLAFYGVLSFSEFLKQVAFAYFAGFALEVILSPLSKMVYSLLDRRRWREMDESLEERQERMKRKKELE